MQYLRSFGVGQTAKMMAALYFLVAAVFAVVTIPLILAFQPDYGPLGRAGVVVLLLCAPVLYAAVSFVMTAIVCSIYNFVASKIGGIAFDLEPPVRSGSTLPG
jgi:hypothetical protein